MNLFKDGQRARLHENQLKYKVKSKNNLIQREFEIYSNSLKRQIKIEQFKDTRYKMKLEENLRKFNSFKKFQFETEYRQQVDNLKRVMSASHPVSTHLNREKQKQSSIVTIKKPSIKSDLDKIENKRLYFKLKNEMRLNLLLKFNMPNKVEYLDLDDLEMEMAYLNDDENEDKDDYYFPNSNDSDEEEYYSNTEFLRSSKDSGKKDDNNKLDDINPSLKKKDVKFFSFYILRCEFYELGFLVFQAKTLC